MVKTVAAWAANQKILLTVGLFALLALKVLVISRGHVSTALAIVQNASIDDRAARQFRVAVPLAIFVASSDQRPSLWQLLGDAIPPLADNPPPTCAADR